MVKIQKKYKTILLGEKFYRRSFQFPKIHRLNFYVIIFLNYERFVLTSLVVVMLTY